jgi:hypothetical protein
MAATKIGPQQAHEHLEANPDTMLVCAYDSDAKFRQNRLEGAISLKEFQSQAGSIPKNREVIFYCA